MHETRQKIIEHLNEKDKATVDELANVVGLTPMAVRYHLNVLQSENLIDASDVRRPAGRGRPQQIYRLTEAADALFPVDYYSLTDYLLDELSARMGPEGITDIFNSIAKRLMYEAPTLREDQPIAQRLDQVVAFLSAKGFVVDWESQDNQYMIHAYSCPYRQLAKEHRQVCLLDKQIISAMLNTDPTRVACLTSGDSHCTYRIPESIELVLQG